jgi:hypothetical protein
MIATIKQRRIWGRLGLALVATPGIVIVGIIGITIVGAIDNEITKLQEVGRWWILLIIAYILALIYFNYEPKIQRNRLRKRWISAFILCWEANLAKEGKPQPLSDEEIEDMRSLLKARIYIWERSDPERYSQIFPNEVYPKAPLEFVDRTMAWLKEQKAI